MPVQVLEDRWPLIVVRWPAHTLRSDVEHYLERSAIHLARREPHLILHDSRLGAHMQAAERKLFADRIAALTPQIREHTVAVAIASTSSIVRGLITAVNWVTPTPCPQKAFATVEAAEDWLSEEFQRRTGRPLAGDATRSVTSARGR